MGTTVDHAVPEQQTFDDAMQAHMSQPAPMAPSQQLADLERRVSAIEAHTTLNIDPLIATVATISEFIAGLKHSFRW